MICEIAIFFSVAQQTQRMLVLMASSTCLCNCDSFFDSYFFLFCLSLHVVQSSFRIDTKYCKMNFSWKLINLYDSWKRLRSARQHWNHFLSIYFIVDVGPVFSPFFSRPQKWNINFLFIIFGTNNSIRASFCSRGVGEKPIRRHSAEHQSQQQSRNSPTHRLLRCPNINDLQNRLRRRKGVSLYINFHLPQSPSAPGLFCHSWKTCLRHVWFG